MSNNLKFDFDLIMSGNGYKQIGIPAGLKYMTVINNTDNTIEVYQGMITQSGDAQLLIKIPMFTALTVPISQRQEFTFIYTNGGAAGAKTVHVFFTEESLNINTPLGSNASLGNVTITGDNVGIAKSTQLPSDLTVAGNLKVDVQSMVEVEVKNDAGNPLNAKTVAHQQSTTIVANNLVISSGGSSITSSPWLDTDGYDRLAVTAKNDMSGVAYRVAVLWSSNGVTSHGRTDLFTESTSSMRSGETPTMLRYAQVVIYNDDAVDHTFAGFAYLKA